MKVTIHITGQINSVATLTNAIERATYDSIQVRKGMFNSYFIDFPTKKKAQKALWKGFENIRTNEPRTHGATYYRGYALSYDAGRAEIKPL
jgi:hypothetical protein